MRINKFLATCGIGSRRAVEQLITDGRVKINDKIVTDLSTQISHTDTVKVNEKLYKLQDIENRELVYIMMNKPRGCVTTCKDEKGRRTVLDILGNQFSRVFPVGRLDYNTEGLLILTNDGDFARRITHPSSTIQKTYIARTDAPVTPQHIDKLRAQSDSARIIDSHTVEIIIHEGKNRQVRNMLAAVGLEAVSLKRISIGNLGLGNLKSGEYKVLAKPPI